MTVYRRLYVCRHINVSGKRYRYVNQLLPNEFAPPSYKPTHTFNTNVFRSNLQASTWSDFPITSALVIGGLAVRVMPTQPSKP